MNKNNHFFNSGLRPAAAMLLCTCVAFSAVSSYVPSTGYAKAYAAKDDSNERIQAEDSSADSQTMDSYGTINELESSAGTEGDSPEEFQPAPYLLNLAHEYPEGSDVSYAETLMREMIQKDSRWYAEIYDMANISPASMAQRLGISASSVLGQYNPPSKTQNSSDPSTWSVEHFKNVRVSFYNGDGDITSAVSNAQDIMSMASVYAYYNDIHDLDEIRSYMNQLWSASHAYQVSMGRVYYCDGCVNVDQSSVSEELEDAELEGEDTFSANRTIDTEITVTETGSSGDGESQSAAETAGNTSGVSASSQDLKGDNKESSSAEPSTKALIVSNSSPYDENNTRESTKSALESLAETAESVYIEETTKKATIIRVPTSTEEETTKFVWNPESETSHVLRDSSESTQGEASQESQTDLQDSETSPESGSLQGESMAALSSISDSKTLEEVSGEPHIVRAAALSMNSDNNSESSAASTEGQTAASQNQTEIQTEAAKQNETLSSSESQILETSKDTSSNSETSSPTSKTEIAAKEGGGTDSSDLVCPGHVDLKITATIRSLSDVNGLYSVDSIGSQAGEGNSWEGWNDRCKAFVKHINRQDWVAAYNLNITVESNSAPLSETEIESYMQMLPTDTSEVRKEIIRFALQSVGKVPYYWGGKPSSRNYSGNNFGSVTIPDHRGRILRGLDCSGWVNWVYWTVTGNRLPYEGTDGLKALGRQVNRQDLQPGDIVVITGSTPHVIMFLSWAPNGQILCVHETGSANNVTVGTMTANWPYYRNLLD